MHFCETAKADTQLTTYAATKKANEVMSHSYVYLWNLPTTTFRFFTVDGPWGRPHMALSKFVDVIRGGRPIDIYSHGEIYRNFTYVEDLVRSIPLLIDTPPVRPESRKEIAQGDSLSPIAPWRVVNIGNLDKERLFDFIGSIEKALGIVAKRNFMAKPKGNVLAT